MFYVYVIQSIRYGYTSYTSCIEKRLESHNTGLTKSTKAYIPYKLIYLEAYQTKTEGLKSVVGHKTHNGWRKPPAHPLIP